MKDNKEISAELERAYEREFTGKGSVGLTPEESAALTEALNPFSTRGRR